MIIINEWWKNFWWCWANVCGHEEEKEEMCENIKDVLEEKAIQ